MTDYVALGLMPRSGSTKLSKILSQDPRLCVCSNSENYFIVDKMIDIIDDSPCLNSFNYIDRTKSAINAFIDSWSGVKTNQIIIDKDRGWSTDFRVLKALRPKAKAILLVRDIRGILASFESYYQKTATTKSAIYPKDIDLSSKRSRALWLLSTENRALGFYLNRIMSMLSDGSFNNNDFLIIRFEDLLTDTQSEIRKMYDFLEISIDFDKIKPYKPEEDYLADIVNKTPCLHNVSTLEFNSDTVEDFDDILYSDLNASIVSDFLPFYEKFYPEVL
jgi:sulfotransferase